MNLTLNYEELKDMEFVHLLGENLQENLIQLQNILHQLLPLKAQYNKMSLTAQIELDLFFAYILNSLHWIHLRLKGIDTREHPICHELQRLKAGMLKWQEYKSRNNRPKVNVEAAKRFIKNGLYDRYRNGEPPNKKIIFNKEK